MKRRLLHRQGIVLACLLLACRAALGATNWYVRTDGNDSNDGTNWPTAFQTISNGVAHALAGDSVLVSNGTYNVSNQIVIAAAITVQGVDGPSNTIVRGAYPETTNRIFMLTDSNAVVDGFTITNGYVLNESGGGVYMTAGALRNSTVAGCMATNTAQLAKGGGLYMNGGTVSNCIFTGNRAIGVYSAYVAGDGGGGAFMTTNGLIRDSLFVNNIAHAGGGIYMEAGVVSNCVVRGNVATYGGYEPPGGGIYAPGGTIMFCLIVSNAASGGNANGGGVCAGGGALIRDCTIMGNTATSGGGIYFPAGGTVRNSLIIRNAAQNAGGVGHQWGCTLQSCTVVYNTAAGSGGGVTAGQIDWRLSMQNSIVYFNNAPNGANWAPATPIDRYYTNIASCTTPEIPGPGGITNDPRFVNAAAGDYRLLSISPCINVGTNQAWMTNAVDIAGNARILESIVDMGAYEFKSNTLQCSFQGAPLVGFTPHPVVFTAYVSGTNLSGLYYLWDYTADGSIDAQGSGAQVVTNTYTSGWYTVSLTVTNSAGEIASATNAGYVHVGVATTYVSTVGLNTWPYTNWTMASTGIQAAVDAGVDGTLVLVTNGTYSITNQITVTNGITVRSVNGLSNTVVRAPGTANKRVFFLSHPDAVLDGLTITNGYEGYGGGVYIQKRTDLIADFGGTVRNCAIAGNKADYYGGGVYVWYGGLLENCTISGNSMINWWYGGGGVYGGTLRNCVIRGNVTPGNNASGAGAYNAALRNCLITGNTGNGAGSFGAGVRGGTLDNCTVCGNWGDTCGGVYGSTYISNSIVYYNTASNTASAGTNISGGAVVFSCSPDLTNPVNGNITSDPQFKNPGTGYGSYHSGGNFKLLNSSPCINKGTNAGWMATAMDLNGLARIITVVVDMGAYEFQPPQGTVFIVH